MEELDDDVDNIGTLDSRRVLECVQLHVYVFACFLKSSSDDVLFTPFSLQRLPVCFKA